MYVSKHKHKDDLGTFGSVLEGLEAFGKRLNAFRTLWERMGAFLQARQAGKHNPSWYDMYGMLCM